MRPDLLNPKVTNTHSMVVHIRPVLDSSFLPALHYNE